MKSTVLAFFAAMALISQSSAETYSGKVESISIPEQSGSVLFVQNSDFTATANPLMMLVQKQDRDYAAIGREMDVVGADAPVIDGNSILDLGIQQRDERLIAMALKRRASFSIRNKQREDALHLAALYGNYWLLLAASKRSNFQNLLKRKGFEGRTVLHDAAIKPNNEKILDFLIKNGSNIEAEDSKGRSPAYCAAAMGNWGNVEDLASLGADLTHKAKDGTSAESLILSRADLASLKKLFARLSASDRAKASERLQN